MKLQIFINNWLDNVIKGNVKANSFTTYKGYAVNHINRLIGETELEELKPEIIQEFVGRLRNDEQKKLSTKGVVAIFSMLSSALECAVDYMYIPKNPCAKIRLPKRKEREIKIFTRDEQEKLEYTIVNSYDKRNIAVLVCLYTGVRIGELCGLKWENVYLDKKQLAVKYSMARIYNDNSGSVAKTSLVLEEPKTPKSKRLLPLPEFICDILSRLKTENSGDFVFTLKNGKLIQPRTMQHIYQRLLQKAGLEYRNFHSLRHTFATRAIELGIDIKTISETLGHSDSTITINRYTHSLMEQKEKMMEYMNVFFNEKRDTGFKMRCF